MPLLDSLLALAALVPSLSGAPTLTTDVTQLSVVAGGTQTLTLDAGVAHASEFYLLLGSASGTNPGYPVGAHTLPLNPDWYFWHTLLNPNLPPMGGSFGILSSTTPGPGGQATATFNLPAGLSSSFIGLTLNHAFVAFDSAGIVTHTSNAVPAKIVGAIVSNGMAQIPAGTFEMGRHVGWGSTNELPVHSVALDAFDISLTKVTNTDYRDYLNSAMSLGLISVSGGVVYNAAGTESYCDTAPGHPFTRIHWDGSTFSVVAGKETHPMCSVNWFGAAAFANWRSAQEGLSPCYDLTTWACNYSAQGYRLPTEAEWEYAARGGNHAPYYRYPWGDNIYKSYANYFASADPFGTGAYPETTPVDYYNGSQTPSGADMANNYGLYDFSGNLWEWCGDWFDWNYYASSPVLNPHGPISTTTRSIRGGSWISVPADLRCSIRNAALPDSRSSIVGFRLVKPTAP